MDFALSSIALVPAWPLSARSRHSFASVKKNIPRVNIGICFYMHVFTTRTSVRFDWHQWTSEQLMSIINFDQETHQPFWNCILIFHLSVRNGYFHICHVMQGISVKIVMISRKKFGFDYFLELGRTEDRGGGFMGGEAHPSLPFYPTNNFCTYMAYMYAYCIYGKSVNFSMPLDHCTSDPNHHLIYHALQISF